MTREKTHEDTHFLGLSLLETQSEMNQRKQQDYVALKAKIDALQKAIAGSDHRQ